MTLAASTVPSGVWIRWLVVPETTCALVATRPSPTGNPLPVTSPPQPSPSTLTVSDAAFLIPGVSTELGIGRAPGNVGSRPANTGGNETLARMFWTRVMKPGAERPRHGVGDAEVVEQRLRGGRPHDHADQQADVLGEREPEASAEAIGHADDGRSNDDEVDQVRAYALEITQGPSRVPAQNP